MGGFVYRMVRNGDLTMATRIIINADDFGFDADTVAATIECFELDAVSGATIMPKMPATAEAVMYAAKHPELSFGAHLTWTGDGTEEPVCPPHDVAALVGSDGRFLQTNVIRMKALLGQLPVAQIARETTAQLALLRDAGVRLTHVDSHRHLHKFKPFVAALREVLPRFGIRKVRNVQDVYLSRQLKSPTYWMGRLWRRRIMRHFHTTRHFYMCPGAGETEWVSKIVGRRWDGDLEVGVHPANPGHAEFWRSQERLAVLGLSARCKQAGFTVMSWDQL